MINLLVCIQPEIKNNSLYTVHRTTFDSIFYSSCVHFLSELIFVAVQMVESAQLSARNALILNIKTDTNVCSRPVAQCSMEKENIVQM